MSAVVVILVVAGLIGHAWMRVAMTPKGADLDIVRAHRELQSRLRYAIFMTLFFGALYVLGLVLNNASIMPGSDIGLM